MRKKKTPPPETTGGVWPSLYHEEEPPFAKRGTTRPFEMLPRPRNRNRPKPSPDWTTLQRIEYLRWFAETVKEATIFKQHWEDPRWDFPPYEWSFEVWLASQRRSGKIK